MTLGELYDQLQELDSETREMERQQALRDNGQSSDDSVRYAQDRVDQLRALDVLT